MRELEHEDNTQVAHKDHLNVPETTQVSPNKSPQHFENREFGKLPTGKVWKDLTDDEKDIIRQEREKLRAEENRKRLAENIEANRKAREEDRRETPYEKAVRE